MNCESSAFAVVFSALVGIGASILLHFKERPKPPPEPLDIEDALARDEVTDKAKDEIKDEVAHDLAAPPKPPEVMRADLEGFRKRRGR